LNIKEERKACRKERGFDFLDFKGGIEIS